MDFRYLPPAEAELDEARSYYNLHRPGLGEEFRDEVRATIGRITAHPKSWRAVSKHIRRCRTRRFPYGVFYSIEKGHVLITAILHLHRRPGLWRGRS